MTDREKNWDAALGIRTVGRDESGADEHHHPYEPTPYCVLERLADSGLIGEGDVLLDYGCGKGRVGFFLGHRLGISSIGIEYDERICNAAVENRRGSTSKIKPDFVLTRAEEYMVPPEVTHCYFFNPFTLELLPRVMARILESWYENQREVFLYFYYPAEEYIAYLMTVEELEFYDEIECDDLFPGKDPRERILVFCLPCYDMENGYPKR